MSISNVDWVNNDLEEKEKRKQNHLKLQPPIDGKILTYPIEVIIVKSLCDLDWLPFNLLGNEDKWMSQSEQEKWIVQLITELTMGLIDERQ